MRFIGRKAELQELQGLRRKQSSSLVVIRGRRRIGKSRLAEEFGSDYKKKFFFSGLPPSQAITAKQQRKEFVRQLKVQGIHYPYSDDWGDLLWGLARECEKEECLILLDEITWMGAGDPTFLGKLKNIWDMNLKKNPNLIMILSGSNSAWIEKNILSSTGFFGRVSLRLYLDELPISRCAEFWKDSGSEHSPYEIFKVLAVTGGVPRYLEEIRPHESAEENLCRLCYRRDGLLFTEFHDIFHDLFNVQAPHYKSIIKALLSGPRTLSEVATELGRNRGGDLTEALDDLTQSGFLSRDYTWSIQTKKQSRLCRYRIKDNYLRFYLKYIEPNAVQIKQGTVTGLPGSWHSILGWQFENLVINSAKQLHQRLRIRPDEIIFCGPYWQRQTKGRPGCQVDYLIQTKFGVLYLCEIKFQAGPVSSSVINEVQTKMDRIKIPRAVSIRPILIHVNEVSDAVTNSCFFAETVNFSDLMLSD